MKTDWIKGIIVITLTMISYSCIMFTEQIEKEPEIVISPPVSIMKLFIKSNKYPVIIVPYFINLYSIQLLKEKKNIEDIKKYILWYLDHLNYPDKYGNTGSIYDYRINENGLATSLETFDSVDSYAATFIELAYKYWKLTGDTGLIYNNRKKFEDIAYLMFFLQRNDGLTIASQKSEAKYLMDNCEVYTGVRSFILLSEQMSWGLEKFYINVGNKLKDGIIKQYYNEKRSNFFWGIVGTSKEESDWNVFYPDSLAQLFPLLHNLIPDRIDLKKELWDTFNKYHMNKINDLPIEQKLIYNWTKEVIENENND